MTKRTVLSITGADRVDFLDGLITNSVKRAADGIIYAALLSPQGKFIADFFVVGRADELLIDVDTMIAPALFQRLSMYRLRADVKIVESPLIVSRGTELPPMGRLPIRVIPTWGGAYTGTSMSAMTPIGQHCASRI